MAKPIERGIVESGNSPCAATRTGSALDVDLRIFIGQMDIVGNLVNSSVAILGVSNLAGDGGTGFITTVVDFATGGYEIAMNDLAGSGNPGFSGFSVGMRFEGGAATSALSRWHITNAPAIGLAFNSFAAFDSTVPIAGKWSFSAPTPSYFYLDIEGTLVPAPGAIAMLGLAGLAGSRRRR